MRLVWICSMIFCLISTYDLQCPTPGQWNLRSDAIQCKQLKSYYCLYDDNNEQYIENCTETNLRQAGYKLVIRQNLDLEPCSRQRYQPFPFDIHGSSDCYFKKSDCSEEGEIIFSNGSSVTDRLCRCDYTRGFAFVSKPNNTCFCQPSKEDCACFIKECRTKSEMLSPDYNCVPSDSFSGGFTCPARTTISGEMKNEKSDLSNNTFPDAYTKRRSPAIVVLVLFILLFVSPFPLFVIEQIHAYHNRPVIIGTLEKIECIEGQVVRFTCVVRKRNIATEWLKDEKRIQENSDITIESKNGVHVLTILASKCNSGKYSFKVNKEISEATLIVRGVELSQDEVMYLRIVHLILRVATPAVREIFDKEFDPEQLKKKNPFNEVRIKKLIKEKHLKESDNNLLFPKTGKPSSKNFDVRLMISLMRNFTHMKIVDVLPKAGNTSIDADLSRIKYYRNQIAHNDGSVSVEDFRVYWNEIMSAVNRLSLDKKQTEHQLQSEDGDPLLQAVTESMKNDKQDEQNRHCYTPIITKEESRYLKIVHLLHREACPAVRVKFDIELPPLKLKRILQDKIQLIQKLQDKKLISSKQWELLYPKTGVPSSKYFNLNLMKILLWYTSTRENMSMDDWKAIQELYDYTYIIAQHNGCLSLKEFRKYLDEISKRILLVGGEGFFRSTTHLFSSSE